VIENESNYDIFSPFLFLLILPSTTFACIGAEAAGMGDAYVSAVDDVTAVYWNPARSSL
jgi:hypothetical protein